MSYAVITGASSGIGKHFAAVCASQGYDLILIARRKEALEEIGKVLSERHGTEYKVLVADLSDMEEVKKTYEEIKSFDIDIFFNNAGLGDAGRFTETDLQKELFMIDVNIKALHAFTKYMLSYFKDRGEGYLLNVGSSAGLLPAGPFMATYYASKSYVVSLSRALAEELKQEGSRVYVGVLCPGPVNTEFNDVANVEFALPGISASDCAKAAYRGMKKRQTVIVPTATMKLARLGSRLLPEPLTVKITAHQQKKKKGL